MSFIGTRINKVSTQLLPNKRGILPLPASILEIQSEFLMGARLKAARPSTVKTMGLTALDAGAVNPSSTQLNISNTEGLGLKLRAVSKSIGGKRRLGLLLPDGAVRVNILAFETLPPKVQEREALLRWRIKDGLGFAPEQATLSYQITLADERAIEVLLIAVKTEILAQYLAALQAVRAGPILILPATMALLPLLPDAEAGGQLLIHVHSGWVTSAVVTGDRLRFWRTRRQERAGEDSGISEAISEAARAAASVRDRMAIEIKRVWYCARPGAGDDLEAALGRVVNCPAASLPLDSLADASLASEQRKLFGSFGAPVAGLIMNGASR
jgi:hypothetical protein